MGRRQRLVPALGSAVGPWQLLTVSVTMANSLVLVASSHIKWGEGAHVGVGGLPRSGLPAQHRTMHLEAETTLNLLSGGGTQSSAEVGAGEGRSLGPFHMQGALTSHHFLSESRQTADMWGQHTCDFPIPQILRDNFLSTLCVCGPMLLPGDTALPPVVPLSRKPCWIWP